MENALKHYISIIRDDHGGGGNGEWWRWWRWTAPRITIMINQRNRYLSVAVLFMRQLDFCRTLCMQTNTNDLQCTRLDPLFRMSEWVSKCRVLFVFAVFIHMQIFEHTNNFLPQIRHNRQHNESVPLSASSARNNLPYFGSAKLTITVNSFTPFILFKIKL